MNFYGDDELKEACRSEMISDLNIILDRKTTPAFFCMVQYYGREHELCGDKRNFEPELIPSPNIIIQISAHHPQKKLPIMIKHGFYCYQHNQFNTNDKKD
ncbi:unnamed protein product [Adineta steineri]|uniref:Uncharacterized protein n=1 Tax=Adineta steineri TaxID=433720 RepID=A0A814R6L3_9BILA|nr:unnamed protein product [Adineta steineri]CAF1548261.1 unnamed protein product [Adineta steineri]